MWGRPSAAKSAPGEDLEIEFLYGLMRDTQTLVVTYVVICNG